jgi:KipI family sensor histidine kinase inhibitor
MPVGARALLVEVAGQAEVQALYAEALHRRAAGDFHADDVVPGARTVLFDGVAPLGSLATSLPGWRLTFSSLGSGPVVEVPAVYDGDDLHAVAAAWGVAPAEVGRTHSSFEYTVAFCGFSPGFAYMTGLPAHLAVPRLETPRTVVPAGAVAVAGEFTGVYPRPSPGGWRLIGRTELELWEVHRDPPALLGPGVRVRFVEVGR